MSAQPTLYTFRSLPKGKFDPMRVYTEDAAANYTVKEWGGKYGTTYEQAVEELKSGGSNDFVELTSAQYKKYHKWLHPGSASASPAIKPKLYTFRNLPKGKFDPSRVYTEDAAAKYTVREWSGKYGTTYNQAVEELNSGVSNDFVELTSAQYNKYEKSQRTVSPASSASPAPSPTRRRSRCPRGTRRNKRSGLCERT